MSLLCCFNNFYYSFSVTGFHTSKVPDNPFHDGIHCDVDVLIQDGDEPMLLKRPPQLDRLDAFAAYEDSQSDIDLTLPPVILIPGFAGSLLDVSVDENQNMPKCANQRITNSTRLWIDTFFFMPIRRPRAVDCFYDQMALNWNKTTNRYASHEGVTIDPVGHSGQGSYGGIDGCDYLARILGYKAVSYYGKLAQNLERNGYRRGVNLFAAPYDWRIPINANPDYMKLLGELIEKVSSENKQPAIIVGHSMGNLIANHFLSSQSDAWKHKNVQGMISIAAPWGGAPKALREVLSGDTVIGGHWYQKIFGIFDRHKVATLFRNFGSLYMMFPADKVWGETDLVYFEEDQEAFKAKEIEKMLSYLGLDHEMVTKTSPVLGLMNPPGVPLYCFNGRGLITETHYAYKSRDTGAHPQVYCSEGDGTVPAISYRLCDSMEWRMNNRGHPITYKEYYGLEHTGILQDEDFISSIVHLLKDLKA